jgi:hypothetical protein
VTDAEGDDTGVRSDPAVSLPVLEVTLPSRLNKVDPAVVTDEIFRRFVLSTDVDDSILPFPLSPNSVQVRSRLVSVLRSESTILPTLTSTVVGIEEAGLNAPTPSFSSPFLAREFVLSEV